jgi:serine/threonine protein kinase
MLRLELGSTEADVPVLFSSYEILRVIGTGSFSTVCLVVDRSTDREYACKIVSRRCLAGGGAFARFEQEVRLLPSLVHPNIVRFEQVLYHPELIFVLMEHCPNGDLFTYIVENGVLPEHEARELFAQILSAVHFLHSKGIVHRDLKPENVLLDEFRHAKLGDFGFCHMVGAQTLLKTRCGSPFYAPPEIIARQPYDGRIADVWSLGIMLFTMVTGSLPWSTSNQVALFKEIAEGCIDIPSTVSPRLREMLIGMLQRNPAERTTTAQLLGSAWAAPPPMAKCRHAVAMSYTAMQTVPGLSQAVVRSRKLLVRPDVKAEGPAVASMPPTLFPVVRPRTFRKSLMWS